jgi:molybdopterin synthase catalytic subunit
MTGSVALAAISAEPLDPVAVQNAVVGPEFGAVVLFAGVVRNHDDGRRVQALEYSAHPQAERFLRTVCGEVSDAAGLPVAAVHRVGALDVGGLAIVVAVAAPHRAAAFRACEQLVDRIKHEVPIWKRQLFSDGMSEWIDACGH